jgi:hypothetical protein
MNHPPCSPDLDPADFRLVPELRSVLKGSVSLRLRQML